MTTKYLIVVGNSHAIVLDKPLLAATGIDRDTELEITAIGGEILIHPVRAPERSAALEYFMTELFTEHALTFQELAQ